jgi:membrane protein DedA with SNARE-associated domain
MASIVSSLTGALGHMSGSVAMVLIAVLVFGETAVFLGFVLPGEAAVVFGGVLASRGHLSLPALTAVVVVTAVTGPLVGYQVGRQMGDRLFTARVLSRVAGPLERARTALREKGGMAVFGGRFIAIVRALMPAAAGAADMPYRTFAIYNLLSGVIWGVGYTLLGYAAGSAYAVVERRVGAGLAIALAVIVIAAAGIWAWRRHRSIAMPVPVTDERAEPDSPEQADQGSV